MTAAIRPIKPATESADALSEPLVEALAQRGLLAPALLYATGHRPLAFAAGHLLALAAPLAAVLGFTNTMQWAHLLTTPSGVDRLHSALARQAPQERTDL